MQRPRGQVPKMRTARAAPRPVLSPAEPVPGVCYAAQQRLLVLAPRKWLLPPVVLLPGAARGPRWTCCSLLGWPQAGRLLSPGLDVLIHKMELITLPELITQLFLRRTWLQSALIMIFAGVARNTPSGLRQLVYSPFKAVVSSWSLSVPRGHGHCDLAGGWTVSTTHADQRPHLGDDRWGQGADPLSCGSSLTSGSGSQTYRR